MEKSLIDQFTKDIPFVRESLSRSNWIRQTGEPCCDTNFNNLLSLAIADQKMVTSLKQILKHMLSLKTNPSLQRMI